MALSVQSDPPKQFSSGFELSGTADTGALLLTSPIGNALAQIRWTNDHAQLTVNGQTTDYASMDALMRKLFGTPLPLSSLFLWLHGQDDQPAGWTANLAALAQGHLSATRYEPEPGAQLRLVLDQP